MRQLCLALPFMRVHRWEYEDESLTRDVFFRRLRISLLLRSRQHSRVEQSISACRHLGRKKEMGGGIGAGAQALTLPATRQRRRGMGRMVPNKAFEKMFVDMVDH